MDEMTLIQLQTAHKLAWANYELAKTKLQDHSLPLQETAQLVNDAWLEFKNIKLKLEEAEVLATMKDLYAC